MRILTLIGDVGSWNSAQAKILGHILNSYPNETDSFLVYTMDGKTVDSPTKNATFHAFPSPYQGFNPYRLKRKLSRLLNISNPINVWHYFYRRLTKTIQPDDYDEIWAIAGDFSIFEAAYRLANRHEKRLHLLFLDAFSGSEISTHGKSKKRRFEKKWVNRATTVLANRDNPVSNIILSHPNALVSPLPLFSARREDFLAFAPGKGDGSAIYGGQFYKQRPIQPLDKLAGSPAFRDIRFEIYSPSPSEKTMNLDIRPPLPKDDFAKKCKEASYLIHLGNKCAVHTVPSKFLDLLAYKKPILAFDTASKAPFYSQFPNIVFIPYDEPAQAKAIRMDLDQLSQQDPTSWNQPLYRYLQEYDADVFASRLYGAFHGKESSI